MIVAHFMATAEHVGTHARDPGAGRCDQADLSLAFEILIDRLAYAKSQPKSELIKWPVSNSLRTADETSIG
jgi:hypothetical protein